MPDVDELVTLYNRIRWKEDDFVAIGLYRKIADEETLRFYYQLIYKARNGYVIDDSKGDIANALMELGSLTFTLDNLISVDEDGEPTGEPIRITIETVDQAKNYINASIGGREAGERLKEMFGEK